MKDRLKVILTFVMVSITSSLFAQPFVSVIEPLKGEKWWGAVVTLGADMPYMKEFKVDMNVDNRGNQTTPLFVSNSGRYIWSDEPYMFEIKDGAITITSKYEEVKAVLAGKTLREAYLTASHKHFPSSEKLPASMLFTHPQYNTWIELLYNQNEADILRYAEDIKKNRFPEGVLMIDDNWQKYYGNFEFKPDKFPDPKGMIDKLHGDGFKVMLWICPFVSPDSPEYRDLAAKGYLIKNKSNDRPAIIEWWNGFSACYDLTNPEAYNHLLSQLRNMQKEYGIDGFKFDAGDAHFYTDAQKSFAENATPTMHTQMWCKMGLEFEYNEFRASWKMGGQPLVQRLCDKSYNWGDVSRLIPDMIATSLMGHAYSCPDLIGGGQISSFINFDKDTKLDGKLITRAAQVHAMMPMMQFSVAPWRVLDEKDLSYCRSAAELHVKMGDYIMELAKESASTGAPIIRHMEYEFPNKGFSDCSDQFMLGNRYLIAPITSESNTRKVRLPNGRWKDDTGKLYKGPLVFNVTVDEGRLLYFEYVTNAKKPKK